MIRRFKFISLITAAVVAATLFAACGNKAQNTKETKKNEVESKVQKNNSGEKDKNNEIKQISGNKNPIIKEEKEDKIICIDSDGNEVEITKKPKKAIVAYTSMLDIWYMAGGKVIGIPESRTKNNIPEEARNLDTIGHVATPSAEKVIALQPDLVILSGGMDGHRAIKDVLDQNNIQNILIDYTNYHDFSNILDLFARINGEKDVIENVVPDIQKQVQAITDKCPKDEQPKVLCLFAAAKDVSCETSKSHLGTMVEMLGGKNIVENTKVESSTKVQFSIEKVIEQDPDYVLITTMGKMDSIKERMKEDIESNEAWAGLRAVKEGKVYYMPTKYTLYKPNTKYPEAFEYIAKIFYPEVFGE